MSATRPVVATVHGIRAFSLSFLELGDGWRQRLAAIRLRRGIARDWRRAGQTIRAVVADSHFAKRDLSGALGLRPETIHTIHLGLDRSVFNQDQDLDGRTPGRPYLLHVSCYRPGKNVDRVVEAYASMPEDGRPDLYMKVIGYPRHMSNVKGMRLITDRSVLGSWPGYVAARSGSCSHPSTSTLTSRSWRRWPCGCPVITSTMSSCPEIAGGAAVLVDPRSVSEIATAMARVAQDEQLRATLQAKGSQRVQAFSWQQTGDGYLRLFGEILAADGASPA